MTRSGPKSVGSGIASCPIERVWDAVPLWLVSLRYILMIFFSAHQQRHFCARLATPCSFAPRIVSSLAPLRGRLPREPQQCLGSSRAPVKFGAGVLGAIAEVLLYLSSTCRRLTLGAFSKDPRLGPAGRSPGLPKRLLLLQWLLVTYACAAHMKVLLHFWYSARAKSELCAGKCLQTGPTADTVGVDTRA